MRRNILPLKPLELDFALLHLAYFLLYGGNTFRQ